MTIAEKIRLTRQQKNLAQKELAERSGVNLKSLSRYELGTSIPQADTLKAIADALGVTTDYLLNEQTIEIHDKELLQKFEAVQHMNSDVKAVVNTFLDLVIRDHKTKQVYAS